MLSSLHIENIAVIEQADIDFDAGFNVLTGETGAGKSIVIDAISAILGERASRDMIRTGADRASVTGVFTDVPALSWFSENGVELSGGEVQIRREVRADGKSVCRVNGAPVTATLLRQLGLHLINIHGQHDAQQLFDEATHLGYLDAFAGDEALREAYGEKFAALTAIRAEMARFTMDETEKQRLADRLRYEIDEIGAAELKPGEDDELAARRKILQNAEKLASGLDGSVAALYGDEDSEGAADLMSQAERTLASMAGYSDELSDLHERLRELVYSARDIAEELRDLRDGFEFSGDELERIESRLDVIHRLRRKYGPDVAAILDYCEKARAQLDEIEFSDDHLARLQKQEIAAKKEAETAAKALREARIAAAEALSARICDELRQLDMPRVQFQCEFSEIPLGPDGADGVRFLMSANAGESLRPISRVASGGELARIMLAMKNVLAEQDEVATLIFDEVDAGVSGRAAQKVAEKLASVAKTKQVLCVTHLPQLAAMADTHFSVEKQEQGGRTFTRVTELGREARIRELARLTGGAAVTPTLLQSAAELLDSADALKKAR